MRALSASLRSSATDFLLRLIDAKFSEKPLLMGGHWQNSATRTSWSGFRMK